MLITSSIYSTSNPHQILTRQLWIQEVKVKLLDWSSLLLVLRDSKPEVQCLTWNGIYWNLISVQQWMVSEIKRRFWIKHTFFAESNVWEDFSIKSRLVSPGRNQMGKSQWRRPKCSLERNYSFLKKKNDFQWKNACLLLFFMYFLVGWIPLLSGYKETYTSVCTLLL